MQITDNLTPELQRIQRELRKLNQMKIHIGIQGTTGKNQKNEDVTAPADIVTIANVHEFGATITAKRVKHLAIPLLRENEGKSPRDIPGLFFIMGQNGIMYGVTSKGNKRKNQKLQGIVKVKGSGQGQKKLQRKNNDLTFHFLLIHSVKIPERSFVRAAFDNGKEDLFKGFSQAVSGIIRGNKSANIAAKYIGRKAVDCILLYMADSSNFKPKGKIAQTMRPNYAKTPLIVTGRLMKSVTFRIEDGGN